jgi:hypothetical protein
VGARIPKLKYAATLKAEHVRDPLMRIFQAITTMPRLGQLSDRITYPCSQIAVVFLRAIPNDNKGPIAGQ